MDPDQYAAALAWRPLFAHDHPALAATAHAHPDGVGHRNGVRYRDTDGYGNGDSDLDAQPDGVSHIYGDAHLDGHGYPYAHDHADTHSVGYTDGHVYPVLDAHAAANAEPDH